MYVASEVGYYLAHRSNANLILFSTLMASFSPMDHAMGMPHNTAYLPYQFLDKQPLQMSFLDRLKNTVLTNVAEYVMRNQVAFHRVDQMLDKHFPNESSTRPSILEMEQNAAAAIHSGHPLLMDGLRCAYLVPNFTIYSLSSKFCDAFTVLPAYSDTLGTRKKCHCNHIICIYERPFGTCQNCHCKRGVTVTGVTVGGEICTALLVRKSAPYGPL